MEHLFCPVCNKSMRINSDNYDYYCASDNHHITFRLGLTNNLYLMKIRVNGNNNNRYYLLINYMLKTSYIWINNEGRCGTNTVMLNHVLVIDRFDLEFVKNKIMNCILLS